MRIRKQLGDKLVDASSSAGCTFMSAVPDAQAACARSRASCRGYPTLLALSANSPFVEGADRAAIDARRAAVVAADGRRAAGRSRLGCVGGGDRGRRYAPPLGRVAAPGVRNARGARHPDQQTDVRRSAGFAAIVQALVSAVARRRARAVRPRRSTRAPRRTPPRLRPPAAASSQALAALVEPAACELGTWHAIEDLLDGPPEAERQLELGPPTAVRDLAARSLASPP